MLYHLCSPFTTPVGQPDTDPPAGICLLKRELMGYRILCEPDVVWANPRGRLMVNIGKNTSQGKKIVLDEMTTLDVTSGPGAEVSGRTER